MTDPKTVRDHNQPCKHKENAEGRYWSELGFWCCWACPGGKEIILDKEFLLRSETDVGRWVYVVEVDSNE